MRKKEIEMQILYDDAKEMHDRYVIELIQKHMGLSDSEAIKLWFSSRTKERIQNSDQPDIRLAYPTMCYGELEKEISGSPMWFHSPF